MSIQLSGIGRFDALLAGVPKGAYDRVLLDRGAWLVAPTLGAVVAGWVLALPRSPFLNFRECEALGGPSANLIISNIAEHLRLDPEDILWFEHGPAHKNTLVGCGLDHAHLHILIKPEFGFEIFASRAQAMGDLNWSELPALDGYASVGAGASYYIAGRGDRCLVATDVEAAGSQFFRRVVADVSGADAEWDYRRFSNLTNVERTVAIFRQLESAIPVA